MIKVEKKNTDYITSIDGSDSELVAELVIASKALVEAGAIQNLFSAGCIIASCDDVDFHSEKL